MHKNQKLFKNITQRQKQFGIGVIILLITIIGVALSMRAPEMFDPNRQLGALTAASRGMQPCVGPRCTITIRLGCMYNNPPCGANQICTNNQCIRIIKLGCAYNNPSCGANQNCVNNQCVNKTGCLYGNPSCNANQNCVNNICQTKQCSNGTLYGQCSVSKPQYCDGGNLINKCSVCGCLSGQSCVNNACVANIPATPVCGNGKVEAGEQCDDGNTLSTDSCIFNCKNAVCGDANIQTGIEQCDDGNTMNTDSCLTNCKTAKCGDGYLQANVEQCDDGNVINGDGCNAVCKIEASVCGNGKVETGEQCDDGNKISGDGCTNCIGSVITSNVPKKFLTLLAVHDAVGNYNEISWERALPFKENDNIQIFEVPIWDLSNPINPKKLSLYKFDKTFDPSKYASGSQEWVNYRESFNVQNIGLTDTSSATYRDAFKVIMKTIAENQPAEHYGIKYFGHGSGDGAIFGYTILRDDAELLFSYTNSIIGKKIDFLDWNTNCGVGTYNVVLSQYQYADYILASDLNRGSYTFDINDYFKYRPSENYETYFSPAKTIRQSLIDMINSERMLWETETTKNDMIARKINESVSIYDTSKFNTLISSINLSGYSGDVLNYIKKNYPAQEQKFYDFRFHYVSNKDFFTWDVDTNGFNK